MKITAVIPARGGSKGIPRKNLVEICGKPLFYYALSIARRSRWINDILVSTEDAEIAEAARALGPYVPFLRDPRAATDTAMEYDILRDLDRKYARYGITKPDVIVWLRPPWLFRLAEEVDGCIETLLQSRTLTAVRSICRSEARLYRTSGRLLVPLLPGLRGKSVIRRQDVPAGYAVYAIDAFRYPKDGRFSENYFGRRVGYYEIGPFGHLDIDDAHELELCRSLMDNPDVRQRYFPELAEAPCGPLMRSPVR